MCHNHDAPFDFVYAAFMCLYDIIVALANRSGGKTMDMAVLTVLDSFGNDGCESANFGAIKKQALKCYKYFRNFLQDNKTLFSQVDGDITMSGTKLLNKSEVEILVATMSGVNSPHVPKLKADEIDLIPWVILQEALSIPQSKGDIKAVTILGSTRKFAHGPMQRMLDNKQAKLFQWCIYEVMKPWPSDPLKQQMIKDKYIERFGNLDLLPTDLSKFNGYYSWDDLFTKLKSLDEETFRSQWLCQKPDSSGLIYPKFDEILNANPHFALDRSGYKSIQIWEDFGYAKPEHPNAIAFVEVDVQHMSFTIFDELWLFEMGTQDIIMEVIKKLQAWHLVEPELEQVTPEQLLTWKLEENRGINYAEFFTKIGLWVPDYHGLVEIKDRMKYGCPIPSPFKVVDDMLPEKKDAAKLYLKENGIPHVRSFVDSRRFKYVPQTVVEIAHNFMEYSKKRKQDGTWTDDPEKKNDHGPDLVHYGTIYNWPNLAYQSFDPEVGMTTSPQDTFVPEPISPETAIIGETYTGGLMDRIF